MHSAAALSLVVGLIITYARLCAALMTRIPPCRRFAPGVDPGKATRASCSGVPLCMSGVMIYPIPSMSQCECDCLWDASQCVSYALLSSTRYKT